MDKGQGSAQLVQNLEKGRGSEPRQSLQNPDKVQGIEVQSVQNPDIGEQFDYCTLPGNFGVGTKGQSFANPESFRKWDSQPLQKANIPIAWRGEDQKSHLSQNVEEVPIFPSSKDKF